MRKLGIAIGVVALTSSARVDAETRYLTHWFFRVDYIATGQFSDSTDSTASGPVMMPLNSQWRCERKAAALTKGGSVMAGYACWNTAGFVNVMAVCAATEAAEDRSSAGIGDTNGSVILTARCRTSGSAPPPPKPADKSL